MFLHLYAVHPGHTALIGISAVQRVQAIRDLYRRIIPEIDPVSFERMHHILDQDMDVPVGEIPGFVPLMQSIKMLYDTRYPDTLDISFDHDVITTIKNLVLYD